MLAHLLASCPQRLAEGITPAQAQEVCETENKLGGEKFSKEKTRGECVLGSKEARLNKIADQRGRLPEHMTPSLAGVAKI